MKVLHCGQKGIKETSDIDLRQRYSQKRKTAKQEEIVAWQPVTLRDDTLPTVLGTVNKCVCVRNVIENVLYKRNKTPMCGPVAASPACQMT